MGCNWSGFKVQGSKVPRFLFASDGIFDRRSTFSVDRFGVIEG